MRQFFGVIGRASNIGRESGDYSVELFQADFPQFFKDGACFAPPSVLASLIAQANDAIQPDKWGTGWRYAAGLYVAHYMTLYLQNYTESPKNAQEAAATGSVGGTVKRATLGDTTVEYDTGAVSSALSEWGDFNATSYGQQFATRARMVGMGGMGVI